jgi:peptidoglycan/xylan/chitin deacetylase (PgdA/CDA1 family)
MESIYEYGSRAGFWRLWRLFTERRIPVTVYGVAVALARNPEAVTAMAEADWEIASHGLRWIDYKDFSEAEERAHLEAAIRLHREATGEGHSAGTPAAAASTPEIWSWKRAASSTIRIPMPTTCPIGSRVPGGRTWWCPTP